MIQGYAQFWSFRKDSGNSFSATFCVKAFEKECFSCYILLAGQISLRDCLSSWDISQYVYWNCLLTRLWRHNTWTWKLRRKGIWVEVFKNGPSKICRRQPYHLSQYHFKLFNGCLPQILLGPFWNNLTQLIMQPCQMFS